MMAVPDGRTPSAAEGGAVTLDRWKMLRTLGAAAGDPAAARAAGAALGLPPCGDTEHAEVFAVNCPPYASVYLGAAGTGRLAAFWAAIGLGVPPEPDHLTTLLDLYARLGEAARSSQASCGRPELQAEHCSGSTCGPGCPPSSAPCPTCRPAP